MRGLGESACRRKAAKVNFRAQTCRFHAALEPENASESTGKADGLPHVVIPVEGDVRLFIGSSDTGVLGEGPTGGCFVD
jgi:hypothetical protein